MKGKKALIEVGVQKIRRSDNRPGEVYVRFRWTHPKEGPQEAPALWLRDEHVEEERVKVEARARLDLPTGSSQGPGSCQRTMGELICGYCDDLEDREVGCAEYRANLENRAVPLQRHLGRLLVSRFGVADMDAYVSKRRKEHGARWKNKRPMKKTTVADELRLVRRAWKWAEKRGLHDREWPGLPSMKGWPDDSRPARKLSRDEVQTMITTAAVDRPDLARFLRFIAHCPRRPVAYTDLRRNNVQRARDPKYRGNDLAEFDQDKGGLSRGWGPLLPEARQMIVEQLEGTIGPSDEHVWISPDGRPWTANKINSALRYLCTKAGVPRATAYDFRKFAAVVAYARVKRDLKATIRFTGHKDVMTLVKFYLFDDDDLVTAAVSGRLPSGIESEPQTVRSEGS